MGKAVKGEGVEVGDVKALIRLQITPVDNANSPVYIPHLNLHGREVERDDVN